MQSNRSAEFFILHSPALIPKFPQSPSSSYLFSHNDLSYHFFSVVLSAFVAIALRLLPVFTQLLFLMQKSCAFLNPKILTSPILRPA